MDTYVLPVRSIKPQCVRGWNIARINPFFLGRSSVDILEIWKAKDSEKRYHGFIGQDTEFRHLHRHITLFDTYEYADMVAMWLQSLEKQSKIVIIPVY